MARRVATALCATLVLTACQDHAKLTSPKSSPTAVVKEGNPAPQLKQKIKAPAGVQYTSQLNTPTPANLIVSYQGLDWVY
ncbi:MAG TPA: hypothetical protein VM100_09105, partial [Longimicrobiales bacterium]|nr:hypothetical protein [Longimicrobiales bacterium]